MSLETEYDVPRPTEIPRVDAKPDWGYALKRALAKFSRDQCTNVAAMLTYFALFSLFPALAAIVSLLGVFQVSPQTIINVAADLTEKQPDDPSFNTLRDIITRFSTSTGAGFALLIGLLTALWSASGYVSGFSAAMNRIYGVEEGRPVFKLRPWLYLVTVIEVILILVVLLAVALSGKVASAIGDQIGLGEQAVQVWNLAKLPCVVLIIVIVIGMLYWATPNVKKPRSMFFSWGALVAFVVCILGSAAFALYVQLSAGASYQKTFGPFAAAVLFLFWLWLINMALLFGAELDSELYRTRQLKSGLPAEEVIQLPMRDDEGVEKMKQKLTGFIEGARTLQLGSGKAVDADGLPVVPDRQPTEPTVPRVAPARGAPVTRATLEREIDDERTRRRDGALREAAHARKVRARLEAQERKAAAEAKEAEKERQQEEKARQAATPREERWATVEKVRARFDPRPSAAREDVGRVRAERRATFRAEQAEKAANPPPPKPPKAPTPPMPSPLREDVKQERADRRRTWYAEHRRTLEDVPLVKRRDRKP